MICRSKEPLFQGDSNCLFVGMWEYISGFSVDDTAEIKVERQ